MKCILYSLLISFLLCTCSSNKEHLKRSRSGVLCIACGISGSPDKAFYELDSLVGKNNYKGMINNLFDKRPAVLYVNILALEELENRNKLRLSDTVQKRIHYLKSSYNSIILGFGCSIAEGDVTPLYFTDIFENSFNTLIMNPMLLDVENLVERIIDREF